MFGFTKVKVDYNSQIDLYKYDKSFNFKMYDYYVIETKYGLDLGKVIPNSIPIDCKENLEPEYKIVRIAEQKDLDLKKEYKKQAGSAFELTKEKIRQYNLPMKLINVYFFLDRNKILFNFTADGRVDFRKLVKDLASTFRTRIELRQIGVRDEATLLKGYGVCGLEFCCTKRHCDHEPISIKMAKEQNLTLNSVKISGVCGRLMCCLDYELDYYQDGQTENHHKQKCQKQCVMK